MNRFFLVFSLFMFLAASCSSRMHFLYRVNPEKSGHNPVMVYITPPINKQNNYDLQLHDFDAPYIIIRKDPKVMEISYPSTIAATICHGVIGEWSKEKDTLLFKPRIHYYMTDTGEFVSKEIHLDEDNYSFMEVPQSYLIKQNSLVDITDYSYLGKVFFGEDYREMGCNVFVLVK